VKPLIWTVFTFTFDLASIFRLFTNAVSGPLMIVVIDLFLFVPGCWLFLQLPSYELIYDVVLHEQFQQYFSKLLIYRNPHYDNACRWIALYKHNKVTMLTVSDAHLQQYLGIILITFFLAVETDPDRSLFFFFAASSTGISLCL